MKNIINLILIAVLLSSCTSYKTTWDCPKVTGIGCSSLDIADEVARKQILLNTGQKIKKRVLIRQNETEFTEEEIY